MTSNNPRDLLRDEVYMDTAKDISRLSKDENTHIGCIIVSSDGSPVSWGYNGAISGCDDSQIPHSRSKQAIAYRRVTGDTEKVITLDMNKYPFMSHAESNAIYFADNNKLVGSTLYVTAYPCQECAKSISRAGISRVVINTSDDINENSTIKEIDHESECIMARKGITLTVNGIDIKLSPL